MGHNGPAQDGVVDRLAAGLVSDRGHITDEDSVDVGSELSSVSRRREGDVLIIGQTKDQGGKVGQATSVDGGEIAVSKGGVIGQVVFAVERAPETGVIGGGKENTGGLEIKDNVGDVVGVVDDGAPTHISRNHSPVGISGEGDGSAGAVIEGGVLSEDEGSRSRTVNLDGEDRGGGLEVLGSISTNTETNISVGGRVFPNTLAATLSVIARVISGTISVIESGGLELPSAAVRSDGEVAEVEGISVVGVIEGTEESLSLSVIITAVIASTTKSNHFRTITAETSDVGVQEEGHVSFGVIVKTNSGKVSGAEVNSDTEAVGIVVQGVCGGGSGGEVSHTETSLFKGDSLEVFSANKSEKSDESKDGCASLVHGKPGINLIKKLVIIFLNCYDLNNEGSGFY